MEAHRSMTDPGKPPPPLFLDQTEARRATRIFLDTYLVPPISKGVVDPPPRLISRSGSGTVG